MPQFAYKAKKGPREIVEGTLEAENQSAALNKLSSMGYFPITVKLSDGSRSAPSVSSTKKTTRTPAPKPAGGFSLFQRVSIRNLSSFTRQLGDLVDSGVPLYRAVEILYEQETTQVFKKVLEDVKNSIKDGKTLHESLSRHPRVFSPLFVNMIKSGEIGGMLEEVLERLGDFTEKEDETRSKIKSAMAYPIFMVLVGTLMIIFLLTFVIPRIASMFKDMGQTLPIPTQIVLAASTAISQYWWAIIIVVTVIIYAFSKWKKTEDGGYLLDKFKLRIPLIKDLVLKDEIARFGRTLSTLLNNGVPIIQSLSIIVDTIKNKVIQRDIAAMIDDISKGSKLGECLKRIPYFPALFINMVAVGEESGHVEKSLNKVAETYDKQVDRTIKTFTSMLEPLMIAVLGLILGIIVISIVLPIFEISNIAQ
ncbi:MAG: type II secretion system F family protein [Candidatus Auribacter fodinae]|jgi:type II secretory pathway component PulF|uniref:General secretion pathway protein F n=1 Tax=Candidatus Auribacter fodinae TaxID=2093366 RepID=A0A3A4R5M4_9BACT|nr:MAG: type II secretion system F family protein [Candidatus Auribacter fodinae]